MAAKINVAVVQQRVRNVQKRVMHVQSCCFGHIDRLLFCRSRCFHRRRCFCSHPEIVLPDDNVTSHFFLKQTVQG